MAGFNAEGVKKVNINSIDKLAVWEKCSVRDDEDQHNHCKKLHAINRITHSRSFTACHLDRGLLKRN